MSERDEERGKDRSGLSEVATDDSHGVFLS
jgi:hypothetical protein